MAEKTTESPEEKADVDKILDGSTEKATKTVEKSVLIAKQNAEMKRLLRLLPFQIFILVADADGKIDQKEVAQFKEFLGHRAKNCSTIYTRRMFHSTLVNYTDLTNRYLGGGIKKDIGVIQKAAGYIQMSASEKVRKAIFKDLKELAVAIAEASGGIMGMTSPINKKEEAILEEINMAFNQAMEPDELNLDVSKG